MYKAVEDRIRKALRHHIHERYKTDVPIVTERPPKLAMGEVASPLCFELAKRLKKPPRALAQEIANSLKPIPGVARVEVAGGGYLNAFFDRAAFFRAACEEAGREARVQAAPMRPKTMVEHTSINPNKAAHIGHLRNAVLGDTFARLLRYAGRRVEVQNYIDNTGVQVADVVLGFLHLEPKSLDEVRALAAAPRFDYLCWDLYARVTQFLAEDKSRLELRSQTLQGNRRGPRRSGADGRSRFHGDRALPPAHARPAGHRLRPALARKRNPAPEILGRRVRNAEAARRDSVCRVRQECRLLGDAAAFGQGSAAEDRRSANGRARGRGRSENHRALQRHGHLRGKGHRQPSLEIRPARRAISTTAVSTSIPTATRSGRPRAESGAIRAPRPSATRTKCST